MTRKGDKQGPSPKRAERYEAMQRGDQYYTAGRPCKRGHEALRVTDSGVCVECRRVREKERYWEDPEKARAHAVKRSRRHAKLIAARAKLARDTEPPEKRAARLQRAKEKAREWRKNNPRHHLALTSAHKARIKRCTPPWVDKSQLVEVYKNCPEGHHVDHIVPLRGAVVSGLHVPWNLQYLPARENIQKSNRFEVSNV